MLVSFLRYTKIVVIVNTPRDESVRTKRRGLRTTVCVLPRGSYMVMLFALLMQGCLIN